MRVATVNVNGIRAATRRGFADWLAGTRLRPGGPAGGAVPAALVPPEALDGYSLLLPPRRQGRTQRRRTAQPHPAGGDPRGFRQRRVRCGGSLRRGRPRPLRLEAHRGLVVPAEGRTGRRHRRRARPLPAQAAVPAVVPSVPHARAPGREGKGTRVPGDGRLQHRPHPPRPVQLADELLGGRVPAGGDGTGSRRSSARGRWWTSFRGLHPDTEGPYSWWSWMGNAFNNDVGWRIDYHLATPALAGGSDGRRHRPR